MKDYGEEKAKRELEELLQIIPVKTKNQEFINDVNENILNHEYRLALEKVKSMTPGGLGIFMVKKYADALEYAYTKKTNRLYIKKCI